MGGIFGGQKQSKTVPELTTISIVPRANSFVKAPGNESLPGVSRPLVNGWRAPGLDAPLPEGWTAKRSMRVAEIREAWQTHCSSVKIAPAVAVAPLAKRTPTRLAVNILSAWEESDFEFADGHVINGRFTVVARIVGPRPEYDLVDDEDAAAECVLRIQPATKRENECVLRIEVLQALARSKEMRDAGNTSFLLLRDAFFGPDDADWAVIEDRTRGTLRSRIYKGSFMGKHLVNQLCQMAVAILKGLDALYNIGCVHTNISLDTIVLSNAGIWKIGSTTDVKSQSKYGLGVRPRAAIYGRLRPVEVLLGCSQTIKSDVFDFGLAVTECALGVPLAGLIATHEEVEEVERSVYLSRERDAPSLFEELGALFQLLGPVPATLAQRAPGKEAVLVPGGGFLRTLRKDADGSDDCLDVVQPPPQDPKLTLLSLLSTPRLGDLNSTANFQDSVRHSEFVAFAQELLTLDPDIRCSPKQLSDNIFLTNLGKEPKAPAAVVSANSIFFGNGAKGSHTAAVAAVAGKVPTPATAVPAVVAGTTPAAPAADMEKTPSNTVNQKETDKLLREGEALVNSGETDSILQDGEAALKEAGKGITWSDDDLARSESESGVVKRVQTGFVRNNQAQNSADDDEAK